MIGNTKGIKLRIFLVVWLAFAGLALAGPAAALPAKTPEAAPEFLHGDTSSHEILIKSDFTGTRIVVFGAVENSRQPAANSGYYDIVIVIRGPRQALVTRRKKKVAGVWLNTDAQPFIGVPSYYAVLSTRPLGEIGESHVLLRHGLGVEHMTFGPRDYAPDRSLEDLQAFRDALLRIKQEQGLYRTEAFSVAFISKSLFRGTVELPANVPAGQYTAGIYLFRDGQVLSNYQSTIDFEKAGFEYFVHALAFDRPVIYGIAAVTLAILAGLLASVVFPRRL